MNKFTYDNTGRQQEAVLCYAFHPDLLDASLDELRSFLQVLSLYYPRVITKSEDSSEIDNTKLSANITLMDIHQRAYSNVKGLIDAKVSEKRHSQLFWLSLTTLVVLTITLLNDFMEGDTNQSSVSGYVSTDFNGSQYKAEYRFSDGVVTVYGDSDSRFTKLSCSPLMSTAEKLLLALARNGDVLAVTDSAD